MTQTTDLSSGQLRPNLHHGPRRVCPVHKLDAFEPPNRFRPGSLARRMHDAFGSDRCHCPAGHALTRWAVMVGDRIVAYGTQDAACDLLDRKRDREDRRRRDRDRAFELNESGEWGEA